MTAQFKDRLFEAMKNKGVKSADVCRATGFSSSLISQYLLGYSSVQLGTKKPPDCSGGAAQNCWIS